MFTTWSLGCSFLWALAAGGMAWHCTTLAQQITYVTLADGRREQRMLPLLFRLLIPLSGNVAPYLRGPALQSTRDRTEAALVSAGFNGILTSDQFLALRVLVPLVYGFLWLLFIIPLVQAAEGSLLQRLDVLVYAVGPLGLAVYPGTWLRSVIANRHNSIRRALPFVLDLLTLSVEAGLDFMTALQRNVERRKIDPLNEELLLVIREIQVGKTRREALRDMSLRVNLPELKSVVGALVQADELGVSIGSILRIQSDQMRLRRFQRAEKLAHEAPVKMLGPLMFFIFPAVFLVLLGPILFRMIQQGF